MTIYSPDYWEAQDSNMAGSASPNSGGGAQSSSSNGKISDKQVRDEVITIFIAGHETTANALTWTFYLLSQYPDVEKKLHDEIDSVLEAIDRKNDHAVTKVQPLMMFQNYNILIKCLENQ